MSNKKPILSAVLTTLGLLGLASADPADPQSAGPPSGALASAPEPSSEAGSDPSAASRGVILLTDGQVVQGMVVQDETGCLIKTPLGSKRFPRRRIEKTFSTIREAYEYKLSQFPEEDTQERIKLAQWCLAQSLQEEAKTQLKDVLKINPKHPVATAMLEKIEQAEVRKARRQFDPGVQQARATSEDMAEDGPKELDPATLARSRAKPMPGSIADVPDIFNLPRPTALKITEEFGRSVHLILQNHCAKCHNERYSGDFQLRQAKSRRDLNRDTLNINLEATLRLIDPLNPSKSELLSSSLRPHGLGKTQRPIFRGSNDPYYLKLSHWVDSVCKPFKTDAVRQASARGDSTDPEEQFAADRALNLGNAVPSSVDTLDRRGVTTGQRPQTLKGMIPPAQIPTPAGASPNEFPLLDMSNVDSMKAAIAAQPPQPRTPIKAGQVPPASAAIGRSSSTTPPQTQGGAPPEEFPALPPGVNDPATIPKKKKKVPPVKLDPALLEGVLKARNGGN